MNPLIKTIRSLCLRIVDNIDAGNSNLSEEECLDVINMIRSVTDKEELLSKEQASNYLNMSTQNFDVLRRKGYIPAGIKKVGVTNLLWNKKVLDECIADYKANKPRKYASRRYGK